MVVYVGINSQAPPHEAEVGQGIRDSGIHRDDVYLGVLPLWKLVSGNQDDTVAEAMSLNMTPIGAEMKTTEVARRFETHDMLSAPVVDENGQLLGRITVDDVIDVIREEGEHQFMGGAGLSEEEDMFAPVLSSTRRRALWLGINLATAFLASWVIGQFEETLSKIVALAVLMPIVASMGGIAGSQTLTLAIRGIALGQLSAGNARALLFKELAVGTLNSLIWAAVVAAIAGVAASARATVVQTIDDFIASPPRLLFAPSTLARVWHR